MRSRHKCLIFFCFGGLFLSLSAPAAEPRKSPPLPEPPPHTCAIGYAKFIPGYKHLNRKEKVVQFATRLPQSAYNFLLKNTINDYRQAWSQGPKSYRPFRLLKRFLLAPRVRERAITARQIDGLLKGPRYKLSGEGANGKFSRVMYTQPTKGEISVFVKNLGKNAKYSVEKTSERPSLNELIRASGKLDPKKIHAEELKKIQWLSAANEPAIDGAFELASLLKVKYGKSLGLSAKPFQHNISIPGSMVLAMGTGYGTFALIADKIEQRRDRKNEEEFQKKLVKGELGASYARAWEEIGTIDGAQKLQLEQENVNMINAWLENLSSLDPMRPLPPRLFQFAIEGLLSEEQVSPFEDIVLAALQNAQKRAAADPALRADELVQQFIREELKKNPLFREKSEAERGILALVLEPPVFLNEVAGTALDFSWYQEMVATRSTETYMKEKRRQSDVFWMAQLARNRKEKALDAVRGLYPEAKSGTASPEAVLFASMNFDESAKEEIALKMEAAKGRPWFPPAKLEEMSRIDHPFNVADPVSFLTKEGEPKELHTELDYLEVWSGHPLFHQEMEAWRNSPDALSLETFQKLKLRTFDLNFVHEVQEMVREHRPQEDGHLSDPNVSEACFLWNRAEFMKAEVDAALKRYAVAEAHIPVCRYLLSLNFWRKANAARLEWKTGKHGSAAVIQAFSDREKAIAEECNIPEFQQEFARGAQVDLSTLNELASCREEPVEAPAE